RHTSGNQAASTSVVASLA
ncbi:hypothetical protein STRIP9103_08442, partial [Streptomyces ipomoeae 91-03]